MIDLISDTLTRVRNASTAKNKFTLLKYSKITLSLVEILIAEKYLQNEYFIEYNKNQEPINIKIFLNYKGLWLKKPFFSICRRISKPGKRIFSSYKQFEKKIELLKYNQGISIISTSFGLMSHIKAKKLKKGGEILCYIG